jgi:hypothetical protein
MEEAMKLGDTLRDTISTFTGVATGKHEYLNGCVRFSVTPQVLHDGKPIESQVFDVEQLELVKAAEPRKVTPSGGPHKEPSRPSAPPR